MALAGARARAAARRRSGGGGGGGRARWRAGCRGGWLPPAAALGAAAWAALLAASGGWHRITEPLTTRHEYEPAAARIGDLGAFVSGYVGDLGRWPVHVQGHPPGPVVLAWGLDRIALGGAGWLALVVLAAWGGAAAAALAAVREVAGEGAARRAAPALVLLPAAVWAGTSVDALFAGIAAQPWRWRRWPGGGDRPAGRWPRAARWAWACSSPTEAPIAVVALGRRLAGVWRSGGARVASAP